MTITEIDIYVPATATNPRFLAYAKVVLDGALVVHDLKVVRRSDGVLLVAMPSRRRASPCPACGLKVEDGAHYCSHCAAPLPPPDGRAVHYDVVHPIDADVREGIVAAVLAAYAAHVAGRPAGAAEPGPAVAPLARRVKAAIGGAA